MKAKLVFSRFFHEYKKNNSVICYNALTMEKFEVSCEEMHAIKETFNTGFKGIVFFSFTSFKMILNK